MEVEQKINEIIDNLGTGGVSTEVIDGIISDLNDKADVQDLDGIWKYDSRDLVSNVTLAANTGYQYDLSSYLPNDSNVYEVIFSAAFSTPSSVGNTARLVCRTDIMEGNYSYNLGSGRCAVNGQAVPVAQTVIVVVGTGRYLGVRNVSSSSANGTYLTVVGYRKVR